MAERVPIRTCISCGKTDAKGSLVRVVRLSEGGIALDPKGKAAGRGAYVCLNGACFDKACKKKLFNARLRTKLSSEDYEVLKKDFSSLLCQVRRDA